MRILILAAMLGLVAPVDAWGQPPTPEPPAEPSRPVLDAAYLLGSWVPREGGNRCGTDAAITFREDGSWTAVGDEGRFAVSGNRIRLDVTSLVPGHSPGPNVHEVSIVSADEYRAVIDGGITLTMVRCPDAPGKPGA
ncbi:MAG TPA: hypothetical protein VF603_10495 [Allosphingosinicella sp.]|jgi:hypothetical protein